MKENYNHKIVKYTCTIFRARRDYSRLFPKSKKYKINKAAVLQTKSTLPLSIKWLATRCHVAIQPHRLISLVYFVDIVRRHLYPHSWILNTPVFLFYILDAYIWRNYWHRIEKPLAMYFYPASTCPNTANPWNHPGSNFKYQYISFENLNEICS